jgi:hypothetical protein
MERHQDSLLLLNTRAQGEKRTGTSGGEILKKPWPDADSSATEEEEEKEFI